MNTEHPGTATMALWSSSVSERVMSGELKEVQNGQKGGQEAVKVIGKDKEEEISRTRS